MLWTEKYRPNKLNDIVGQPSFTTDAMAWVKKENMPNIILSGVAGVGKTASAIALANDILGDDVDNNFFEINASDDRKLETVRTRIKEIASTSKIGDVPFKIILLDEMDGMTKDAQNALKRIMERYADNCRFVITANDTWKIISPLLSRCAFYHFNKINDETMKTVLTTILENEQKVVPDEEMDMFICYLQGDLRRGVTELQASVASGRSLTKLIDDNLEPYTQLLQLIADNDYTNALNGVHNLIHTTTDMRTICRNLHDVIIKSEMESNHKFKLLRIVGEAEWRSSNMTPKVLASWMIGQMV
jgi:replication factor C small subunit